jgi:hypothetical protein
LFLDEAYSLVYCLFSFSIGLCHGNAPALDDWFSPQGMDDLLMETKLEHSGIGIQYPAP